MKRPKRSRTSILRVSETGQPAPSWTPDAELTRRANECFRALVNPHAKPDLIRVFRHSGTGTHGRCWVEQRIIVVNRALCDPFPTLAHEVAHLRFKSHGPRHEELTAKLLAWLRTA
jgi:hypothetical protein